MSTEAVDQSTQEQNVPQPRRSWLWPAVVAAMLVVGVVAVLLAQSGGAEADALATVDGYFETFNGGDVEATLEFLSDDGGDFSIATVPADTPFAMSGYDETTRLIAWSVAADTVLFNHDCSATDDGQGPVLAECSFEIDEILRKTLDLPSLTASMTVAVDGDRFVAFDETVVLTEGSASGVYLDWLAEAHPDEVELAAQVEWGSIEEAVAAGEARARYVEEWSASLAEQPES
jgi:hypothetical protein